MKSEPDVFSIHDLERVRVEPWTGVRSMFARFHMRAMSVGDAVLFHHSNAKPSGVAGLAKVVRTGVIDELQFDPESKYYDPKATRERHIWDCVDVEFVSIFPHFVPLDRVKTDPELAKMVLLNNSRLSVQPVTPGEYERIVAMGHTAPPPVVKGPRSRPVKKAPPKKSATKKSPPQKSAAKVAPKKKTRR
jgi:predicted RNA-binding protein with PUA-like domain